MQEKVLDGAGEGGVIPVGQVRRLLELMDRRVGGLDDALGHARQDHRAAPEDSRARTELQLVVHYLLYEVAQCSMQRALFLAEVRGRCFRATERALASASVAPSEGKAGAGGKAHRLARTHKGGITPAQYASPLEVVRLYETAMDAVEQMEILPGASGREDVEEMAAVCRAGKLLYMGEAFRVTGSEANAATCYHEVVELLAQASTPHAKKLRELAERIDLEMKVDRILGEYQSSSTTAAADTQTQLKGANGPHVSAEYLTEIPNNEIVVAKNVVQFPPDYQAVACKPVFVDIASTYLDFPRDDEDLELPARKPDAVDSSHSRNVGGISKDKDDEAKPGSKGNKWRWRWGW
ncbi:unnamed protein product [Phytomonas sp. EM1]|nr:unnamed protein product [Phytomonas sp. EM1]|eukprot:CCW60683.1 unnamed protein product [Phytomonas sp. isolate EM1]